jgi:hypothetical protein
MLSTDAFTTETSIQRAGIEYTLPTGRFEWTVEGWFNPKVPGLSSGQAIHLLHVLSGVNLSVAARVDRGAGPLRAGRIVKNPDGTFSPSNSTAIIAENAWCKWKLRLLRICTRETNAVLYTDDKEKLRVNWDSTVYEPLSLRAGIGLSSAGATATVLTDELRLTESQL